MPYDPRDYDHIPAASTSDRRRARVPGLDRGGPIDALGEMIHNERLQRSRTEVLCSFCGKGRPEVEVVAGPAVNISAPCAETVIRTTAQA